MPAQEIPTELRDSSPDSSFSGELPAPAIQIAPEPAPAYAAAQIHIRVQPPPPPPPVALPDNAGNEDDEDVDHHHGDGNALRINQRQQRPPLRRIFSYDRDIPELEEDNHWPGRAYLLPVVLPQVTEPTLDELLRRVTGRTDLQQVDTVKLRVISYMVSLSRLSLFMPRLAHLDLSGSVLHSLRDLGCGLVHLTHLNVSNCGLSSFDGTSGLPSVQVLIADGNMVQLVGPLADLPLLKKLSARHNRIFDLGTLSFLGMCPNLLELELQGNPVTNLILYRLTLERSVATLELLDGEPIIRGGGSTTSAVGNRVTSLARQSSVKNDDSSTTETDESAASTSPPSSLTSEVYSESSANGENVEIARPSTTGGIDNITPSTVITLRRPASGSVISERATNAHSSLTGLPIVGSVLDVARRRKRYAWGASSSSSISSTSSSSTPSSASPARPREFSLHTASNTTIAMSNNSNNANSGGTQLLERHAPRRQRTQLPPLSISQSSLSSLEENGPN